MSSSPTKSKGNGSRTFLQRYSELRTDKTLYKDTETEAIAKLNDMKPSSQNPSGETSPEIVDGERNNAACVTHELGNEGLVSEQIPHYVGLGLSFKDGAIIYEGQSVDGTPDGRGKIKWTDGSWYEGEFQRGLRHGHGLHVSAEDGRRCYSGQWTNGQRNGSGKTAVCNGESDGALDYDGDWVNNRPHGNGTGSWPDGTVYTGIWVDGRPHGRGRTVWPTNDVYEGDWIDGYMDGMGTYEWNSNPRDCDQLVLCLCDRYTGQWSKSKKHGLGEFYSAKTGSTIRGRWLDDALEGPCEIVLPNGKSAYSSSGLVFRNNVLYGPPPPPPPPSSTSTRATGRKLLVSTVDRDRRLTAAANPKTNSSQFLYPCKPRLPVVAGNNVQNSDGRPSPCLVRVDLPLTATASVKNMIDLTGHVEKMAAKRLKNDKHGFRYESSPVAGRTVDLKLELQAAESALETYMDCLKELYRAYGAFLASGPVTYWPIMTRLGLWQILIDNRLHARLSLADFDDLLYENGGYAFQSTAHDPFEPIYFWQFVNAVCELAIAVYAGDCGTMASALHALFAERLKTDPVPYCAVTGDGKTWVNSRKTVETMYGVYRVTVTACGETLPTAVRLVRLYGPKFDSKRSPPLNSLLPTVLDVMFDMEREHADCFASPKLTTMFEYSAESIVSLLSEACPKIVDAGLLVALETRLTFAEWYRFVLLCIRHSRRVPIKSDEEEFVLL